MEIEVLCQQCNAPLDVALHNSGMAIYIGPCADCLEAAHTKGYEAGKDEGVDEGYILGHNDGYDLGHKDGYDKGYAVGREDK